MGNAPLLSFSRRADKKKKENKFLLPIPKLFELVSCCLCSSWDVVELEMLLRDFAANPGRKQVRVCKTTVAGLARFLKQASYEICSIKLHDSVPLVNEPSLLDSKHSKY